MSNEDLLVAVNDAAEGENILVSCGGMIFEGRHRRGELQRRINDGRDVRTGHSVSTSSVGSSTLMSTIYSTDPDFRVCQISFDTLLEIQLEAEERGWGTRWTSVDAVRSQVKEEFFMLQSLMREERGAALRAYRCLLLFSTVDGRDAGGIATIDLAPSRFESLERLDRDPDVRKALVRMFSLAAGGISMVSKK